MALLTPNEYARMEQLLADLLPLTDGPDEAALLNLHARLQSIYASQSNLQASRDRLTALQSRTAR